MIAPGWPEVSDQIRERRWEDALRTFRQRSLSLRLVDPEGDVEGAREALQVARQALVEDRPSYHWTVRWLVPVTVWWIDRTLARGRTIA